jgi:dTDP-glucose 4,6-dehydratase
MHDPLHTETILVTGAAGFIGANFIHFALKNRLTWRIINLDALTYAGNLANLAALPVEHRSRHTFVHGDIRDTDLLMRLFQQYAFAGVIHFAAESHVDRSIRGPQVFVDTKK